jgi:hypothetical protein
METGINIGPRPKWRIQPLVGVIVLDADGAPATVDLSECSLRFRECCIDPSAISVMVRSAPKERESGE